jgi:hypothetical protein
MSAAAFCPRGQPAARIGNDLADAFDTADPRDLAPFAAAHIGLGAVEAEGADGDDDRPGTRLWSRPLLDLQALRSAVFVKDDRPHVIPPSFVGMA